MKYKDWDEFKVCCSSIYDIIKPPVGVNPLTDKQKIHLAKIIMKPDDEKTEHDKNSLIIYSNKTYRFLNPELSQASKKYLIRRYGWEKYNKRVVPYGKPRSPQVKGNELEIEAIKLLCKLDKVDYFKPDCMIYNDYIYGICDIHSDKKIIDIKTSWNITSFLTASETKLSANYWYQMQGYMELYDIDVSEVCFVLLNTPPHLVDRERAKQTEKYVFGEITREKYDEEIEKCDLVFDYEKIPAKRRVLRFQVNRDADAWFNIKQRVVKCREWLGEFERKHIVNKNILTLPEKYVNVKEDNIESDTAEPLPSD